MDTKIFKVGQIVQSKLKNKYEVISIYEDGTLRLRNVTSGEVGVSYSEFVEEVKEMENYICINGKKTELTQEQLRQLGIETEEDKKAAWEIQTNLHMQLYKKLREFAFKNGSAELDWNDDAQKKYYMYYDTESNEFKVSWVFSVWYPNQAYFTTSEIAERAIEEVAEPFMKEHPEFKW